MKKILVILGTAVLFGCNPNQQGDTYTSDSIPWQTATSYSYKGHVYIKFGGTYQGGAVHDPECELRDIKQLLNDSTLWKENSK